MNTMIIFALVMLFIFGVGVTGLLFFVRWLKKQNPSLEKEDQSNGESPVQSFFGIKGIDRGVMVLTNGRFRVFIEAPSVNVPLMAEEEQMILESRFQSLLARINFPIQLYGQNRPLDMGEVMEELSDQYDDAPENLKDYADELKDYLLNLSAVNPIWTRRKFVVIPYDEPGATIEEAIPVLDSRARLVLAELDAAGIEGHCLTTEEIVQALYVHLNKGRTLSQPFRNVIDAGHTHAYVTARGGDLIEDEFEDEAI